MSVQPSEMKNRVPPEASPDSQPLPPMTSDAHTELEPVIAGLPWADRFEIGAGMNAVTGSAGVSAIRLPDIKAAVTKSSTTRYRFIASANQLEEEIDTAAKAAYNMGGVNLSASAQYVTKIKVSELYLTLVAQYHSSYSAYDEASSYELTDEAKKLIGDAQEFRKRYGDYFIAGQKRGASFTAVYTCHARSVESMSKFMTKVGADAPEVFTTEGSSSFVKAARSCNIEIDVYVDMRGYRGTLPGTPQEPKDIPVALEWFKKHEEGTPQKAKLFHYSTIDRNFPQEVPIDPIVFAELSVLYKRRWAIQDAMNALPKVYQDQYRDQVDLFETSVATEAPTLATDAHRRGGLSRESGVLLGELNDVLARQDFYYKVSEKRHAEPLRGQTIAEETGGPQVWLYGFKGYPQSKAVTIHSTTMNYYAGAPAYGYRQNTFVFGPDDNKLVVGWEVVSNWQDGTNGSWSKVSEKILLSNQAQVHVNSQFDRGCDWTVSVYYVDATEFQF